MDARTLARQLQALGEREDKILAHINAKEAALLAKLYGGDVNPITGLPQFGFFSSIVGDIVNPITSLATGTIGALTGGGSGSSSPGGKAAAALTQDAQPLLNTSNQLVSQYNSGNLNAADTASLAANTQAAKSAADQYYSTAGLGTSSAATQAQGQITQNETIAHQNLLNNYLTQAEGAFGAAMSPITAAVGYQFQQDQANQQALSGLLGNIFGSAGVIGGLGGLFGGAASGGGVAGALSSMSAGGFGAGGLGLAAL